MADKDNIPVIFLAFANDRDDTVGYLRNLPNEARLLRESLGPAEQAGLCEVVVRSNSTADDIFKVLQDPNFRNRVAILHYGGHANGYELLLESAAGQSAAADAGGLAAFLAQQQGLQLVFLNGCSTQEQTQGLLDANIPAVISTSRAIDDGVATDFSHRFYQGLAGGATIRTAYNEAEASVQTSKGSNTRGMYIGKAGERDQPEADHWPWHLYLRDGSEAVDQWNLPDAVDDPLFGLPPLPEQDLPESPYRHLNWFTRKDAEVFFGRGHQIRKLYDRLTAPRTAPIVLFYGQSGVGKSSILDAGLIPRLQRDYEVRYVRRTERGLHDSLSSAVTSDHTATTLDIAWRQAEETSGKPLIVFLDQVEELYTRPVADLPDELSQFLQLLKATFSEPSERPKGKLVLGFRKEWLAELEAELIESELPRTKVFLEPLDRRGIIEVVKGPTLSERLRERYGLDVEDGLAEVIADDLLEDRDSAIAPTLQILLTKLWKKATEENYENPQFTQEHYQQLKRDGILLRDFLDQQITAFRALYPDAVDSGLLLDIVAMHTTALGTAGQCSLEQLQEQYTHLGTALPDLLQQCQDLYLLTVATSSKKDSVKTTRLAHDTLAPLVRERFEQSDKPGQRARRILESRAVDWSGDNAGTPLDEADLDVVEQGVTGTRTLSTTEQRLLEASVELRNKLQRTRRMRNIAGVVAIAAIAVLGIFGWVQANIAKKETARADVARDDAVKSRKDSDANKLLFAARDQLNADNDLALLLAVEGAKVRPLPDFEPLMRGALTTRGQMLHTLNQEDRVTYVAWNPIAATIVSTSYDDDTVVWDASSGVRKATCQNRGSAFVAWSRDGIHFVTGGEYGQTRLWRVDDESCTPIEYLGSGLIHAAWSPDGTQLAVAAWKGEAMVWNSTTNTTVYLRGHAGDKLVNEVNWSPVDSRVVTVSDDGTARVWNAGTGDELFVAEGHESGGHAVKSASWSSDNKRIVTALSDGTARVWDAQDGRELQQLRGHTAALTSVTWAKDSRRILTTSVDKTARIWGADSGAQEVILVGHGASVVSAAWNGDESYIATASLDNTARVWDSNSGEQYAVLAGHKGPLRNIAWSPDFRRVVTASFDSTAHIWDPYEEGPKLVFAGYHTGTVWRAAWSADGKRIATAGETKATGGRVRVWSVEENIQPVDFHLGSPAELIVHARGVKRFFWGPDDRQIITAGRDNMARIWNPSTGEMLFSLPHDNEVNLANWNADGTRIVTASEDRFVRIWSADGKAQEPAFEHDGPVTYAAWNAAGTRIASGSTGWPYAHLWDVANGSPIELDSSHGDLVWHVAWSPDDRQILTTSNDKTAVLWDAATGKLQKTLQHTNLVKHGAWNPDGSRVATVSDDKLVRIWDADPTTGDEPVHVLEGHGAEPRYVSWHPNGKFIVSAAKDSTARVWDAETGAEVTVLGGHSGPIRYAAWDKAGTRILTAGDDGTARIHLRGLETLIPSACDRVVRNMTLTEWKHFMGDQDYRKTCPDKP